MVICASALLGSIGSLGLYAPSQYNLGHKIPPATTIAQGGELVDNSSNATANAVQITTNNTSTLTDLFEQTQQSVVQVSGTLNEADPLFGISLGSGFIYDNSGHIITNYHVVAGSDPNDISITFIDGTVYRARVAGADQYSDLAVLRVEDDIPAEKLIPLPLANSSGLLVGQEVVAIGNPFGLSGSMTEGIVSGLNRLIPVYQDPFSDITAPAFSIPDVIQTDAAINPGNSGGPLLNMQGEVVGINSAIFSTTGGFAGVGFSVPSNTIAKVAPVLIERGFFEHPWLGVSGIDMTPEIAEAIGLGEPRGFLVIEVAPGGPADSAGVQGGDTPVQLNGREIPIGGDVVLAINDRDVRKIDDVLGYLQQATQVGETVTLTVWRDGQIIEIDVILGARPSLQESP
ncbi:MAG: trypsin-like peptidase domain-containing protein [Thermoproteota archaeon]|nr:trypsin-like peptidase domain-containing protein [Thermoproteota archaeon]